MDGKPVAANGIYTDSDSDSTASPYYYVNSSGDKVESQEEALVGGIQAFLAGVSQLEDAINLLRRATSNQHFTGMADNYQLYLSSQAEGLLEAFRGFGIPLAFRVQE